MQRAAIPAVFDPPEVIRDGPTQTVRLTGELDLASRDVAQQAVRDALAGGAPFERLILDLRGLTFSDSSGVHLVLDAHARAQALGGRLTVIPAPAPADLVFALTRVEERVPFG